MQIADIPNDWISNCLLVAIIPVVTAVTMRVRNSVCKRRPSLRTKYAVDLSYILVTNMLSFSSLVIWSHALEQPMESVVTVDVLLCMWLERWFYKVIASYDSSSPHPGGGIGREMFHQRIQLYCVLASVLRGYGGAVSTVLSVHFSSYERPAYLVETAFLPAAYALVRTALLDIDTYDQRLIPTEQVTIDDANSVFTITDDDDDPGFDAPAPPTPPASSETASEYADGAEGTETSM